MTTDPSGMCGCAKWSGGDEPDTGIGCSFTTRFNSAGNKTVTATTCSSQSKNVKVVEVQSLEPSEGTEIDDGDGDPNTKLFRVDFNEDGSEGTITVTATPNPGISESDLPSCWSLSGGDVQDKLHTKVSKGASCKTVVITCTAGTSYKKTTILVCGGWACLYADDGEFPGHSWWALDVCSNCINFIPKDLICPRKSGHNEELGLDPLEVYTSLRV